MEEEVVIGVEEEGEGPGEGSEEGRPIQGLDERLFLAPTELQELQERIREVLLAYGQAMSGKLSRWAAVRKAMALDHDPKTSGMQSWASMGTSELTRAALDTMAAALEKTLRAESPMIMVEPRIKGDDTSRALAGVWQRLLATIPSIQPERWLRSWLQGAMETAGVLRVDWVERDQCWYEGGKKNERSIREVGWSFPDPEDMVVWPLRGADWSMKEIVGDRSYMTVGEFKRWASKRGIEASIVDTVVSGYSQSNPEHFEAAAAGQGIDHGAVASADVRIALWTLFIERVVAGDDDPRLLVVFYDENSQRVLWVGNNTHRSGRHPYFPLRTGPGVFAWLPSPGELLITLQQQDSTAWNLTMDSAKVSAASMIGLAAGSAADRARLSLAPGATITVDSESDIRTISLGEFANEIPQVILPLISERAAKMTGVTSPQMGFNDPSLKSGASSTSLNLLLAQAGQRLGQVDTRLRDDISQLYPYLVETILQSMPLATMEELQPEDSVDLARIKMLKDRRAALHYTFRIAAPDATTNGESRKQQMAVMQKMVLEMLQSLAAPPFSEILNAGSGGAGLEFIYQLVSWYYDIWRQIVQAQDVPGLRAKMPEFPAFVPPPPPAPPQPPPTEEMNMPPMQMPPQVIQ